MGIQTVNGSFPSNHSSGTEQYSSLKEDPLPFQALPVELNLYILSFLGPRELCQIAPLNKATRVLTGDNCLWKPLFLNYLYHQAIDGAKFITQFDSQPSFQELYQHTDLLNHFIKVNRKQLNDQMLLPVLAQYPKACILDLDIELDKNCDPLTLSAAKCQNLAKFRFCDHHIPYEMIKTIITQNKHLQHLSLIGMPSIGMPSKNTTNLIENTTNLIKECKLTLDLITSCPLLNAIKINTFPLVPFDTNAILSLVQTRHQLNRLQLKGCVSVNDEVIETLVCNSPSIIFLKLDGCDQITLRSIKALATCANLKYLTIQGCRNEVEIKEAITSEKENGAFPSLAIESFYLKIGKKNQ